MRKHKLLLCAACAVVTVAAAVTAFVIFREAIAEFFVGFKERIDIKRYRNGEYADYAEM